MDVTGLCVALFFSIVNGAVVYPTLQVDGEAHLGQPASLRCICNKPMTLIEPKGTTVLQCRSTSDCLLIRPEHIFLDRDESVGETYVAVINETRAEDEGDWRCQCGSQEATVTLQIRAAAYPTLNVDDSALLGQPASLRCICNKPMTLIEPKGTTVLQCRSTSDCLLIRPEHIFLDRDESVGETYVAVINETRAEDEGDWRCQCGNQEATVTLRIQGNVQNAPWNSNFFIYPSFRLLIFLLLLICLT